MELWIRSQNRKILATIKNVYIVDEDSEGKFIICGYTSDDFNDYDLGSYYSIERAFEILDEIQNLLQPKIIYTQQDPIETYELGVYQLKQAVDMKIQEVNRIVYEMPQD